MSTSWVHQSLTNKCTCSPCSTTTALSHRRHGPRAAPSTAPHVCRRSPVSPAGSQPSGLAHTRHGATVPPITHFRAPEVTPKLMAKYQQGAPREALGGAPLLQGGPHLGVPPGQPRLWPRPPPQHSRCITGPPRVHVCMCACVHKCVCMHVCTRVCVVCAHVCMCVRACVLCVHTCTAFHMAEHSEGRMACGDTSAGLPGLPAAWSLAKPGRSVPSHRGPGVTR